MVPHILITITTLILIEICIVLSATELLSSDSLPYKKMSKLTIDPQEEEIDYWFSKGIEILKEQLGKKLNTNKAKNVIFFLGDGLSVPTITAARIYNGQLKKQSGEENQLFFETFPYGGLCKTYCVDKQVADSGCTATAYLGGVKGNFATIGVSAKVKLGECEKAKDKANQIPSIVKWFQKAGKATGVVTNTRITHASPAGAYAYIPFRDLESDADIISRKLDPKICTTDIAEQLIYDEPGRNIKVLMGGGRKKFLTQTGSGHGIGERLDRDLINEWKTDKIKRKANGTYITTAQELDNIDPLETDYLLGLFADDHMNYHTNLPKDQPTLAQMTEKAIRILQTKKNGFFLFVEGGKIDHAHHENQAKRALNETIEFDNAIQIAAKLTNDVDTLIVVTADHGHTMSMNGYPDRGYDILGLYGQSSNGQPYATLSYANGPGYKKELSPGVQHNLEQDDMEDPKYKYPAFVPKSSESHGGEDVVVYARGPWAHLFTGTYEQSYIPIAEAFAANVPVTLPTSLNVPNQPDQSSSYKFYANFSAILTAFSILLFTNLCLI